MNLNLCEEYRSMQIFMMEKGIQKILKAKSDWVFTILKHKSLS